MPTPVASPLARQVANPKASSDGSSYGNVSPEVHLAACRRLSWLALIYASVYLCVEFFGFITMEVSHTPGHSWRMHAFSLLPITAGYLLAAVARRGLIPQRSFGNFVVAIQLLGAAGIVGNSFWGWETGLAQGARELVTLGGADPNRFLGQLAAHHVPLISLNGVPWPAIWVMFVPLLLPLSTTRTVVGSLLGASLFPALMGASILAHPTDPQVTWIAWRMVLDATIPSLLCAAMAIVGSRVVYGLTRELSDARQLGNYRLIEPLGTGGMGEVWKAKHQLLARPAAIKLIRAESLGLSDPAATRTALARFEREAQATALLGSPHTIEIYDFGVTESGSFYYVMELLEGSDLRTLVDRHGPVPVNRAVHLLVQACHSLADAHASGLIHRDVKPANIFACRRGREYDFVKVLDFGLVKGAAGAGDVQLTAEGTTTGTPAFMAPEFANNPDRVDARADLYALGCVGFWLVTGRLVFERDTPIQTVLAHVSDAPPRLSAVAEQEIPDRFERVILDCLEKDPAKRPPSAEVLAERLVASLGDAPRWTAGDARRWWEMRGFTAAAGPGRPPADETRTDASPLRTILPPT